MEDYIRSGRPYEATTDEHVELVQSDHVQSDHV